MSAVSAGQGRDVRIFRPGPIRKWRWRRARTAAGMWSVCGQIGGYRDTNGIYRLWLLRSAGQKEGMRSVLDQALGRKYS